MEKNPQPRRIRKKKKKKKSNSFLIWKLRPSDSSRERISKAFVLLSGLGSVNHEQQNVDTA